MEFCSVTLKQLDEGTAEIKVVVNTEVLLTLLRKKRHPEIVEWFSNLQMEIYAGLNRAFGEGPESMAGVAIRTHVGLTTNQLPFVSALAIVDVAPEGGGLTARLGNVILQHIMEAVQEKKPLEGLTGTSVDRKHVSIRVEFDTDALDGADMDTVLTVAKESIEREVRKGYWKLRV